MWVVVTFKHGQKLIHKSLPLHPDPLTMDIDKTLFFRPRGWGGRSTNFLTKLLNQIKDIEQSKDDSKRMFKAIQQIHKTSRGNKMVKDKKNN